ncbi:thiamine pyrophosphate enzyme, N-terminal TPP binding domain-containing protein [Halteromyces radiatus]|uniref:thiamine pyrophosphate enzyme, N-terminal TPP binding domain-containing protein n=1 Tax=Halteromyces radiatus TaxID=101107 RepID=UPI002220AF5B|nr:thiamine pyrophosphate enzyme, N-terminal TPP binding domain-containing protein [Halteromyces radiatus]KAI8100142.1 thiamine pyrophosphate enzyme, N-terminal TPP binding domain-containing protein [Halteromyces radiatus]
MTQSLASGAELIATSLKQQGVDIIFGIVGIPVVEIADACQAQGIRFIGFRNEQSAAYAASAYGYLSERPGVCLTVGGPGVVHGLAGLLNAQLNCWPMVMLSGSCDTDQIDMGAFQELDQVEACRSYCKYASRPTSVDKIPFVIEKAIRTSMVGRPGPTYVDLPADFIQYPIEDRSSIQALQLPKVTANVKSQADSQSIQQALHWLGKAKQPLIVIGKGAAYARAEEELNQLINHTQIPFLPTPMGKGVVSDQHPLCVSAARSKALKEADVVLLVGARLNWILHYGQSPKWSTNVRYIHIDIHPEELGNNGATTLPLAGDIRLVLQQLLSYKQQLVSLSSNSYVTGLLEKVKENVAKTQTSGQIGDDKAVLTYQTAFTVIKKILPQQVIYVSEGANTMDIARSFFDVYEPRRRLDAGTGATMGVGMGYAIAAQCYYPNDRVISIVGDSAFGFSAMELETAIRSKIPLLIIVINNNGIYHGLDSKDYDQSRNSNILPSTSLSPETRYDMIAEACGGKGWLVKNRVELADALNKALVLKDDTCVINVMIAPGGRKKLSFGWMNKAQKSKI